MRDFKEWLGSFREIIADYKYYVDFDKAFRNTETVKVELWFTDGKGWNSAKNNLLETFDVLDNLYNIRDLEGGIMTKIFK